MQLVTDIVYCDGMKDAEMIESYVCSSVERRDYVKSFQMRNKTPLQLKTFLLHVGTGIISLFFGSQIHQYFLKMC